MPPDAASGRRVRRRGRRGGTHCFCRVGRGFAKSHHASRWVAGGGTSQSLVPPYKTASRRAPSMPPDRATKRQPRGSSPRLAGRSLLPPERRPLLVLVLQLQHVVGQLLDRLRLLDRPVGEPELV